MFSAPSIMPSTTRLTLLAFSALIVLCGCASLAETQAVPDVLRIVAVSQWGGSPADESKASLHSVKRITLHHQGVAFPRGNDPARYLRNLQSWSRETRNWLDIPYHFVIDLDGNIYAGRDIRFAGDTNTEYDPAGHALIEVVGNYEEVEPSQPQLDAVVQLMTMLAAEYAVSPDLIQGHRDFSSQTSCPGKNLYRYLQNGYFRERVRMNLEAKTRLGDAGRRKGSD